MYNNTRGNPSASVGPPLLLLPAGPISKGGGDPLVVERGGDRTPGGSPKLVAAALVGVIAWAAHTRCMQWWWRRRCVCGALRDDAVGLVVHGRAGDSGGRGGDPGTQDLMALWPAAVTARVAWWSAPTSGGVASGGAGSDARIWCRVECSGSYFGVAAMVG
jgi:hypothetical protein